MTDKERILTAVIANLLTAEHLKDKSCTEPWSSAPWRHSRGDDHYCHFAPWNKPQPGDLVIANTSRSYHEFNIAFYVEDKGNSNHVVREIGSDRLCNYSNESFTPIVGVPPIALLEGMNFQFYQKVITAFAKADEYLYRFSDVTFPDIGQAVVTVRRAYSNPMQTFDVAISFTPRTTIKTIVRKLRLGGVGTYWKTAP